MNSFIFNEVFIRRIAIVFFIAITITHLCASTPAYASVATDFADTAAVITDDVDVPIVSAVDNTADESPSPGTSPDESASATMASAESQTETPARTRAPRAQSSGISLTDAAATAEKMYYSGELYLFADSMIKINYEMAAIAESVKDSLQKGSLIANRASLNAMIKKYNEVCEKYNSWVDVKADLEFYIDKVGSRNIYSKTQLQTAYKRVLEVINATKDMLGAAQSYYDDQTTALRRALTGSADALTLSAAKAVNTIEPYARTALNAYRNLFDQFALQSGLEIEYKTWRNPETGE